MLKRPLILTALLAQFLFYSASPLVSVASAKDSTLSSLYSYAASEAAGSDREAQNQSGISGGFISLSIPYTTVGNVNVETLDWCENLVAKTFNILPEDQVAAVHNLTLSFDPDSRRGLAGGNTLILRCTGMGEDELVAVLLHEMGHVTDTGLLQNSDFTPVEKTSFDDRGTPVYTGDPSAEFYSISWENNSSFTSLETGFISGYAMTSPFEDFADTYAAYILHGPLFRFYAALNTDLKTKYEFMEEIVFDGVEFDLDNEKLPPIREANVRVYDITLKDFSLESFWMLSGVL